MEEDVDFQERVRDELRRNRERSKGPLGAPAGGERGVHPAGANKEFLGKYGLNTRGTSSRREELAPVGAVCEGDVVCSNRLTKRRRRRNR